MARRSRSASPRTLSHLSDPQLWWYVDDADATCADLMSVASRLASSRMTAVRACLRFHDPAGNTLYMLELR